MADLVAAALRFRVQAELFDRSGAVTARVALPTSTGLTRVHGYGPTSIEAVTDAIAHLVTHPEPFRGE